MRLCRDRRQRQRRQPRHDQLPVLPARRLPLLGSWIGRRDAPQLERRRPQPEAEHDARGLGRRMRSDMGADRGAGRRTDRRHPARIALRGVLRRLVHRVGIAGGDERERAESVDLRDRDFVGHATQMRPPPGWPAPSRCRCPSRRASQWMAIRPSGSISTVPSEQSASGAVILGGASDAGADEHPRLLAAGLLLGTLLPDRMLLQLVENLRRADRDAVRISRHGPAAGLERIAAPELDRVERQRRRDSRRSALPAPSSSVAFRSRASTPRSRRASAAPPW